jgi:hypothetical protein
MAKSMGKKGTLCGPNKNHPVEDASWETDAVIQRHGHTVQELMDRSP